MKIDIKSIRESYNSNIKEFAHLIGLKYTQYAQYEARCELPSKYVYRLWKKLNNFPLPDDFFHYTSFVLQVNMNYHHMTQKEVAKMFDITSQPTLSGYMQENIPMYEKKEYFLQFDPFIIPLMVPKESGGNYRQITDLIEKGNFIQVEKRMQHRLAKQKEIQQKNE